MVEKKRRRMRWRVSQVLEDILPSLPRRLARLLRKIALPWLIPHPHLHLHLRLHQRPPVPHPT